MLDGYKSYWFSGIYFPIGIVKTPSGRTYIGTAQGVNEDDDTKFIAQHGVPIDLLQVIKELGIKQTCENET